MKIIIGANYGDEGKGQTTSYFCNQNSINILTNGGPQRGHTVVHNGIRHIFHHFGSGTLKQAASYFYEDFLIDPVIYLQELEQLSKIMEVPRSYRDKSCRFITPYDVIVNQILERHRTEKHGSCGMGIWQTVKRYREMLCMDIDSFNKQSIHDKMIFLSILRDYSLRQLDDEEIYPNEEENELLYSKVLKENFIQDVEMFCNIVRARSIHDFNCDDFIFENAQGLLLNSNVDNIYTTPSETGCKNIVKFIEENYKNKKIEIIYVTRPYLTRHGNGPFPEECSLEELPGVKEDTTNIENEWQGKLRYGKLDKTQLIYRINNDFSNTNNCINTYTKSIALTHLDEMNLNLTDKNMQRIYCINLND